MSSLIDLPILTWNGISKYYSDKILIDNNSNISNLQWHRFQLIWMTNKLGGNITDPITGCILSRSILGKWVTDQVRIHKMMATGEVKYSPEELQEAMRIGLVAEHTKGNLFWDSFGGYPIPPIEIDPSGQDVIFTPSSKYQFGIQVEQVHLDTRSLSSVLVKPGTFRSQDDPCIKGSLEYFENKCYLDTTLTILLAEVAINGFRNVILSRARDIVHSEENQLIRDFANELLLLAERISNGEIFRATNLVNKLKLIPGCEHYGDNQPQNGFEFMEKLFELIGLNNSGYNLRRQVLVGKISKKVDLSSATSFGNNVKDLININKLYKRQLVISNSENVDVPFIYTSPPIPLDHLGISNPTPILSSQLLCYQIDTPTDVSLPIGSIVGVNGWTYSPDRQILEKGGEIIMRDALKYKHKTHSFFLKGEEVARAGYFRSIDITLINQARFLILNIGRSQVLKDESDNIIFNTMNGVQYPSAIVNEHLIVPESVIHLPSNELTLTSIITFRGENVFYGHYFGFFRCDDNWYKYDDSEGGRITRIGSYDELLQYDSQFVQKRCCSLFYS